MSHANARWPFTEVLMLDRLKATAVLATLTALLVSGPSIAQQKEPPRGDQAVALPEIGSVNVVEEHRMSSTFTWKPSDPQHKAGALTIIRVGPGPYDTQEFALSYKGKKGTMEKSLCRAYRLGRSTWATMKEEGMGFRFFTGNPTTDIHFLFEIPKNATEVVLLYKGKAAGPPFPLTQPPS